MPRAAGLVDEVEPGALPPPERGLKKRTGRSRRRRPRQLDVHPEGDAGRGRRRGEEADDHGEVEQQPADHDQDEHQRRHQRRRPRPPPASSRRAPSLRSAIQPAHSATTEAGEDGDPAGEAFDRQPHGERGGAGADRSAPIAAALRATPSILRSVAGTPRALDPPPGERNELHSFCLSDPIRCPAGRQATYAGRVNAEPLSRRLVRIALWVGGSALAIFVLDLLGIPVDDWIAELFDKLGEIPAWAIVVGVAPADREHGAGGARLVRHPAGHRRWAG